LTSGYCVRTHPVEAVALVVGQRPVDQGQVAPDHAPCALVAELLEERLAVWRARAGEALDVGGEVSAVGLDLVRAEGLDPQDVARSPAVLLQPGPEVLDLQRRQLGQRPIRYSDLALVGSKRRVGDVRSHDVPAPFYLPLDPGARATDPAFQVSHDLAHRGFPSRARRSVSVSVTPPDCSGQSQR